MPFVDRGAREQSLVGCDTCHRGFPLREMTEYRDEGYEIIGYLCPGCARRHDDGGSPE